MEHFYYMEVIGKKAEPIYQNALHSKSHIRSFGINSFKNSKPL